MFTRCIQAPPQKAKPLPKRMQLDEMRTMERLMEQERMDNVQVLATRAEERHDWRLAALYWSIVREVSYGISGSADDTVEAALRSQAAIARITPPHVPVTGQVRGCLHRYCLYQVRCIVSVDAMMAT